MKKVAGYKAMFANKSGIAFEYEDFGIDYRIFIVNNNGGFVWSVFKNISSYKNRWDEVLSDNEKKHKTVNAAKLAALRTLKALDR